MQFRIIILSFILVFAACKSDKVNIPDHIIQPEPMAEILADVHLAESKLMQLKIKSDSLDHKMNYEYNIIMNIHGVSISEFEESLEYYQSHPELFDQIYENVLQDLRSSEEQDIHLEE